MDEERGSAKMLRERIGGTGGISEADIVRIAGLADIKNIVIDKWWWKGQPAIDFIAGKFRIPKESVGDVIGTLLEAEVPIELRVFPKGVVALEAVDIQFRTGIG